VSQSRGSRARTDAATTGLTVTEIVALGRTPHHGLTGRDGAEDREAVAEAVARCGVTPFAHRDHATLSGRERRRLLLARTLAQRPRLLVLDSSSSTNSPTTGHPRPLRTPGTDPQH
jgi:ABC-type cobalamin/Fe3+-siderophores transport system ATPase subunit